MMKKKIYKFSGFVTDVYDDIFVCRVKDMINIDNPEAIIELYTASISEKEKKFLQPGALLDIYVRYYEEGVKQEPYVIIRFKRIYQKQEDIEAAKLEAAKLMECLSWNSM